MNEMKPSRMDWNGIKLNGTKPSTDGAKLRGVECFKDGRESSSVESIVLDLVKIRMELNEMHGTRMEWNKLGQSGIDRNGLKRTGSTE